MLQCSSLCLLLHGSMPSHIWHVLVHTKNIIITINSISVLYYIPIVCLFYRPNAQTMFTLLIAINRAKHVSINHTYILYKCKHKIVLNAILCLVNRLDFCMTRSTSSLMTYESSWWALFDNCNLQDYKDFSVLLSILLSHTTGCIIITDILINIK